METMVTATVLTSLPALGRQYDECFMTDSYIDIKAVHHIGVHILGKIYNTPTTLSEYSMLDVTIKQPNIGNNPTVGDIVDMTHPDKEHFVFFGNVRAFAYPGTSEEQLFDNECNPKGLYVEWQNHALDSNTDTVLVEKFCMQKSWKYMYQ